MMGRNMKISGPSASVIPYLLIFAQRYNTSAWTLHLHSTHPGRSLVHDDHLCQFVRWFTANGQFNVMTTMWKRCRPV